MRPYAQVAHDPSTWGYHSALFEPLFGSLCLCAESGELLLRHQIMRIFEPVDLLDMEFFAQAFQLDRFLHIIEAEQHLLRLDILSLLDSDVSNRTSGAGGHNSAPFIPDDGNSRGVFIDASEDDVSGACHKHSHQQQLAPVRPARGNAQQIPLRTVPSHVVLQRFFTKYRGWAEHG